MAKKKENKINYEEIDGYKYEVKNPSRKNLVRVYQNMVTDAHTDYVNKNRMMEKKRVYAESLLTNISRAPFVLGWLCWPEDENQKRLINGLEPIIEKVKKKKKTKSKAKPKKTAKPKKPESPKKPTSIKKPSAPKKPKAPNKPSIKSIKKK